LYRKNLPAHSAGGGSGAGAPADVVIGTVQGHRDGHGFVLREDGAGADIFLPPQAMRAVRHQDRVKVQLLRVDRRGRPVGRVLEVLARGAQRIAGSLLCEDGAWRLVPQDKRYGRAIALDATSIGQAQPGQIVQVEWSSGEESQDGRSLARVVEVLGAADDPGMEVELAVRKYGVPHVFSDACLAQAQAMPDQVRASDRKGRIDLTDIPFVTIDGEDARDFDDAVYCTAAKIGRRKGWRLLVAIADVSHYVKSGSSMDAEACARATSVYFPRRVIPMLPEKLSNGLCSLNPHVDRLCLVCDMVIDGAGGIHAYQFYPAVLHSHARLTYAQAAAMLDNARGAQTPEQRARLPELRNLHGVYQALLAARQARGAADFDTVETQIVCDAQGRITHIRPARRTEAHRLIEEAMLAANVCSAHFVRQHAHAALYRVHDRPSPDKVTALRNYLKAAGVRAALDDSPATAQLQAIAAATRERADAAQIHAMLLRSMMQALYTPDNAGHYGLALDAYAHFTSPIRRYPDLLLHRVIKAILAGKRYRPAAPPPMPGGEADERIARRLAGRDAGRRPDAAPTGRSAAQLRQMRLWQAVGLHCSACERRADEASRDVQAWLKCQYMRQFVGQAFDAAVSAVTSFGLFVTLDALYVDGLVHISELGSDYFEFDEVRQELRGQAGGQRWRLGARVHVQLVRADPDSRRLDFRLLPAPQNGAAASQAPPHAAKTASHKAKPKKRKSNAR